MVSVGRYFFMTGIAGYIKHKLAAIFPISVSETHSTVMRK